jgi:hypothetical protein
MIDHIKESQREAFEREQKLHEANLKKVEEDRQRAEERKARQSTTTQTPEEHILSQPERYIPEHKPPKVKTKRVAERAEATEEQVQSSPAPILPTLPNLGACAQGVFNQIGDEDWSFIREAYALYLKDFQCLERQVDGSHRVFQLPKSSILTLKIEDQTVTEHIMWAQEDSKLGSVTLPAWKGKEIPFYLRKQLRSFHEKIIALYSKVTALGSTKNSSDSK